MSLSGAGGRAGHGGASAAGTAGTAASGGRANGAEGSAPNAGENFGSSGTGATDGECVVVVRLDGCCIAPNAVPRESVRSDPCLMVLPPVEPSAPGAVCRPGCDESCGFIEPRSRMAEPDPAGSCEFVSECDTAEDCVVLRDATSCCACPSAFPKAFAGESACLVAPGVPAPERCAGCAEIECDQCAAPNPLACLRSADGLGHCVLARQLELSPNQCAAERACAQNPGGGCTVCLSPGEVACGGPAPQPADCTSDAECMAAADNLICEALPCENAHCVQGCLTDEDCATSEVCRSDRRCAASACQTDGDCSPNHACVVGGCQRRACTSSAECDGYCVENLCHETPGRCAEGCAP